MLECRGPFIQRWQYQWLNFHWSNMAKLRMGNKCWSPGEPIHGALHTLKYRCGREGLFTRCSHIMVCAVILKKSQCIQKNTAKTVTWPEKLWFFFYCSHKPLNVPLQGKWYRAPSEIKGHLMDSVEVYNIVPNTCISEKSRWLSTCFIYSSADSQVISLPLPHYSGSQCRAVL